MSPRATDPRLARWTSPLATPSAELRTHASFEVIREETAKLEAAVGAGPDWALVLRHGDELLSSVGRDLVVGASLASALAHREGIAGATVGASLLAALLADPSALPTRARARANAVTLFLGRAELAIDAARDRTRDTLAALSDALDALERAAATLEGEAPSLRSLSERVARHLAALPAPAPEAPPPPPLPASAPVFVMPPAPSAPSPAPSAPEALPDRPEQVPAFLRRTSGTLIAAAALLRGASPLDPEALRLTLLALYLPVSAAPDVTREARTALAPPPRIVLDAAAQSATSAAPEIAARDVLLALEKHRFALDLHLHLSRALTRAGASAAVALHRREVESLVQRLPTLLDRAFSDGSPFASPETRIWLAPAATHAAPPEPEDDPWDEVTRRARSGRASDALALGATLASSGISARERFALRTRLAQTAEELPALAVAAELYAALAAEAEQRDLDAWEPALVAPALAGLLRTLPAAAPLHAPTFARLARLSPAAALEISTQLRATPAKTVR